MDKKKRTFALIAAIALFLLYILLLIFAFGRGETAQSFFRALLAVVFILPVLLYGYLLVARVIRPRRTSPIRTVLLSPSLRDENVLREYLERLTSRGFRYEISENVAAYEKGTIVLLSDDPALVKRTKDAGELAFLYENLETIQTQFDALGIR